MAANHIISPKVLKQNTKGEYTHFQSKKGKKQVLFVDSNCRGKDLVIPSENGYGNLVSRTAPLFSFKEKVQYLIGRWFISIGQYSVNLTHPGTFPIIVDFIGKEGIWV